MPRAFRPTRFGPVPSDWPLPTIREIGDVQLGRQRSPATESGSNMRPYLRVANVFDGRIDLSDVLHMHFSAAEQQRFSIRQGDLLLNEGQSLELVGRCALYDGPDDVYCFQNTLVRFRASPAVDPRFARAVFKRWLDIGYFMTIAKQTTSIAHLGADRFARLRFPQPLLPEQQRIAAVAGALDDTIEQTEALIAKTQQIKAGLMHDLFTRGVMSNGKFRPPREGAPNLYKKSPLGWIPKEWPIAPLGSGMSDIRYGTSAPSNDDMDGIPVLRIPNIAHGELDLSSLKYQHPTPLDAARYGVLAGDLLVIRTNGDPTVVGTCAEIPSDKPASMLFASYLIRIRVDRAQIAPAFASRFLHTRGARRIIERQIATSAGNYNINTQALRALPTPFPPLPEQSAIVGRLLSTERAIADMREEAKKLMSLKDGLMYDLLTGRVRVPVAEAQKVAPHV
jgi:type I restriction enzyme, S subunit